MYGTGENTYGTGENSNTYRVLVGSEWMNEVNPVWQEAMVEDCKL